MPYEPDFREALRRARRDVFEAGDFVPPYESGETAEEAALMTEIEGDGAADQAGSSLEELDGPQPRDELDERIARTLDMTMDQGTHSLLDMVRVGEHPGPGVVTPVPDTELLELLATTRPRRSQVERAESAFLQRCPRWEGQIVVVYDDDKPQEICFLGCSGD